MIRKGPKGLAKTSAKWAVPAIAASVAALSDSLQSTARAIWEVIQTLHKVSTTSKFPHIFPALLIPNCNATPDWA